VTVPPIAEQHRIVAKVDELMALCDQLEQQTEASIDAHATLVEILLSTLTHSADAAELEQNWTRIADHFDTLFTTDHSIDQLKQTVLQLAVMGKLVPQDPFDEPASVLLGRIAAEKAQLVKEKKIKKQNALPSIVEDEKPFDLPQGWEWVRFGSICEIERGGSPRPIKSFLTDEPDGLNWIKIGDTNIGGKYITSTNEKIRKEGLKKTRKVYPGDFLLTNSMSFGRPYITKIEGCIHDGWLRISPPDCLDKDYLYNLLSSPYVMRSFKSAAAGAVVMNLNAEKVRVVCILLPPLEEQHRIVAKVDQLMALCDQLKVQLQQAQQTKLHLADELVSTALV
jgi:type I restriction enzyme S subunit